MCTLVLLARPEHPWPVIVGANRDELFTRPWRPPGRHWTEHPSVRGGLDLQGMGTWLALSDASVLALLLNRPTPDPFAAGLRSRGELPLLALEHGSAAAAADVIMSLDPTEWKPFNLVVADQHGAIWIRGETTMTRHRFPDGLSLLANNDLNASSQARIRTNRPLFQKAPAPQPERDAWSNWPGLLGRTPTGNEEPDAGMVVRMNARGFGTVSSSLLAIPADPGIRPIWRFADGPPDRVEFAPVDED